MKYELTQAELKRLLDYCPDTGEFTWNIREHERPQWNARYAGKNAGSPDTAGYLRITINGNRFSAHRLAWLYVNGVWPENDIDHIDSDKTNNRITNLRDVTKSGNQQNKRLPQRNNRSGYLGVHYCARARKFVAKIAEHGKRNSIGYFETAEAASEAYLEAKRKLHVTCSI